MSAPSEPEDSPYPFALLTQGQGDVTVTGCMRVEVMWIEWNIASVALTCCSHLAFRWKAFIKSHLACIYFVIISLYGRLDSFWQSQHFLFGI